MMSVNWEEQYQLRDTPWDKGAPAPPLLEWISVHSPLSGKILVPGPGLGHDVRAISLANREAEVLGLDIAQSAVEEAKRFPRVGQESYQQGDLFHLPSRFLGQFDWVFEHTCFCAIDLNRRSDYVSSVAAALKPAGYLLAIFYLRPWDPGESPENGGPPFGVSVEELNDLFSETFVLQKIMNPCSAYPGREGREIVQLLQKRS